MNCDVGDRKINYICVIGLAMCQSSYITIIEDYFEFGARDPNVPVTDFQDP